MEALKKWFLKKFLVEMVGKVIAKADGKRTALGTIVFALLLVVKYGAPVFFPGLPAIAMECVDILLPMVGGISLSFAGVKAQKAYEAAKKVGDELVK